MNRSPDKTTEIYTGKIISLRRETITLPNGTELELEIVDHPGGAAVVAVDDRNRVCLVHQYRHIADGYIWELPAGKIDNKEPPIETAQRELADEAGIRAQLWMSLGQFLSSPGVFNETIHLWLARVLSRVPQNTDDDEVLEIHWVDFQEALKWARDGTIRDGKSIAALFRASALLSDGPR